MRNQLRSDTSELGPQVRGRQDVDAFPPPRELLCQADQHVCTNFDDARFSLFKETEMSSELMTQHWNNR